MPVEEVGGTSSEGDVFAHTVLAARIDSFRELQTWAPRKKPYTGAHVRSPDC